MKGKIILKPLLFISFLVACLMLNAQGYISQTIQYDGLTREYSIYVPASYDGTTSFPLLFNFHGGRWCYSLIGSNSRYETYRRYC